MRAADVDAYCQVARGREVVDCREMKDRCGLGPGRLTFNRRKCKIILRDVSFKNAKIAGRSIRFVCYAADLGARAFHERRLHKEQEPHTLCRQPLNKATSDETRKAGKENGFVKSHSSLESSEFD